VVHHLALSLDSPQCSSFISSLQPSSNPTSRSSISALSSSIIRLPDRISPALHTNNKQLHSLICSLQVLVVMSNLKKATMPGTKCLPQGKLKQAQLLSVGQQYCLSFQTAVQVLALFSCHFSPPGFEMP